MRNLKRLSGIAIAVALAVVLAGPAAASDITVGQFIQKIASAKHLSAGDARIAADSLSAAGISIPRNLRFDAPLTEGDVAAIARSAGINVRTASPDAAFGSAKADRFVSSFSGALRTSNGDSREARYRKGNGGYGEGEDEDGQGKGKGKGKNGRTPVDPY